MIIELIVIVGLGVMLYLKNTNGAQAEVLSNDTSATLDVSAPDISSTADLNTALTSLNNLDIDKESSSDLSGLEAELNNF